MDETPAPPTKAQTHPPSPFSLEIVLSISLFLIYWLWGMPNLEREIECNVHGLPHSCVLPNHQVSQVSYACEDVVLLVDAIDGEDAPLAA